MGREAIIAIATGAAAGLLAGLMGVGGGIILVPMMVAFLGLTQYEAHGTSLAIIVPIAVAGAIPYIWRGNFQWPLVAALALGSSVGVVLGARLMMRLSAPQLRRWFGIFLLLVALRLIIGGA